MRMRYNLDYFIIILFALIMIKDMGESRITVIDFDVKWHKQIDILMNGEKKSKRVSLSLCPCVCIRVCVLVKEKQSTDIVLYWLVQSENWFWY